MNATHLKQLVADATANGLDGPARVGLRRFIEQIENKTGLKAVGAGFESNGTVVRFNLVTATGFIVSSARIGRTFDGSTWQVYSADGFRGRDLHAVVAGQ
jgi:hypothetical protein